MEWLNIAADVVDAEVIFEAAALGIGFGLTSLFKYFYRSDKNLHRKVLEAKELNISKNLYETVLSNPLDFRYVAVTGMVTANGNVLRSRYNADRTGVISNFVTEEVKEIWGQYSHSWYESNKEICNVTEFSPFSLSQNNVSVHVNGAENSPWVWKCLTDVHKEFRESKRSTFDSFMGVVTGDRIKGYMDLEKMLLTGTRILGLGELFVDKDNVLQIRKPVDGELILTCDTKEDLLFLIASKLKYWKIFHIALLAISLGGLYFFIKRILEKYSVAKREHQHKSDIAQIRKTRNSNARAGQPNRNEQEERCVICLTNPRECVILDCGHVCACIDCIECLPRPRKCPICRGSTDRIVPIFHA